MTRKYYLLEKLKGERCPEWSLAAHPKAFTGCSSSGDLAIPERERVTETLKRWASEEGECGVLWRFMILINMPTKATHCSYTGGWHNRWSHESLDI